MKTKTFLLVVIAFLAMTLTSSAIEAADPEPVKGLSLKISAEKEFYTLPEDVVVTLRLKNQGEKAWFLERFSNSTDAIGHRSAFQFHVVKDGEKTDRPYCHGEKEKEMFVPFERRRIAPGETIAIKVTLNKWYDLHAAGAYSVVCVYSLKGPFDMEETLPMWEGVLKSNPIRVKIK